jgi:ABC-2 type transport system permease protein
MKHKFFSALNSILSKPLNYLGLAKAYVKLNFLAQLEYRGAFISQIIAMFLNNIAWLVFWNLYFTRFPILEGWTIKDVVTIWSVTASGFGLAYAVFGNSLMLPSLISRGQLDSWMLYPRALLSHLILGRMSAMACGDVLFGFSAFVFLVKPDLAHLALFVGLSFSVALTFVGFSIFTASLSFYLHNTESLCENWRYALVTFSTYPPNIFKDNVKLILYTLIPAGFVSYLPVESLRHLSVEYAVLTLLGSLSMVLFGVLVFNQGLKRYASGNMMDMRG